MMSAPIRTLLIYPEFPDTFWSFKHALRFVWRRASLPPLGLITVASMLPEHWDLRLIDLNVRRLTEEDLAWADVAFISGMSVQRQSAREVITRCKKAGIRIVAGGPLFTMEHEDFPEADHFVLGEAEVTLPTFLQDLENGRPSPLYRSESYCDMQETPEPRWDLLEMKRYASMSIQFSRGCPYDCEFCNVTALFGHRPRVKTSDQIIHELDSLYTLGWRDNVFFVDDNLIGNKRYFKNDLLPALIQWRKGKTGMLFYSEVSINLVDDEELMEMMVAAGFNRVFVGIETPDENSLVEAKKTQNVKRDLVDAVRRLHHAGLEVQGGFIVGFDSDTPSIFQRQIEFIQQSGIVTAMVGMLQAPPTTHLYERMKLAGRLIGQMSGDNADGSTNIIPAMGLETLRKGYQSLMEYIYAPGPYYERVRTFLRDYQPPKVKMPRSPRYLTENLDAFLRSSVRLGIIGRERFHYWRLLTWTLFHRPRSFQLAVTLAIFGYHFRKVTELHVQ